LKDDHFGSALTPVHGKFNGTQSPVHLGATFGKVRVLLSAVTVKFHRPHDSRNSSVLQIPSS
jgi:hypothetical protein